MEKFIERSLTSVIKIFPSLYTQRSCVNTYHFSIACERNKIICIGVNDPTKPNNKAYLLARQFGIQERIRYPYIHAEQNMVSKLLSMNKLSTSLKIVVLRINAKGELKNSKPCKSCDEILSAFGLNRIWFSTNSGEIISEYK